MRRLGSKTGINDTHKWAGETLREWDRSIVTEAALQARMDGTFDSLGAVIGLRTSGLS